MAAGVGFILCAFAELYAGERGLLYEYAALLFWIAALYALIRFGKWAANIKFPGPFSKASGKFGASLERPPETTARLPENVVQFPSKN